MSTAQSEIEPRRHRRRRRFSESNPFEPEGQGGFSQVWYPVALSSDVVNGEVYGTDFLDGRIVVYRDAGGEAHVMSAYCPHMGADLTDGDVVDGEIRCAFHHWCFDASGRCSKTAIGDVPPPTAELFVFPTDERYGVIWAFNGEDPLYEPPTADIPFENYLFKATREGACRTDPSCLLANSFDLQHVHAVHGWDISEAATIDNVDGLKFDRFRTGYHMKGEVMATGQPFEFTVAVFGNNCASLTGTLDGRWMVSLSAVTIVRPGEVQSFLVTFTDAGDGSDQARAEAQQALDILHAFNVRESGNDLAIVDKARFVKGALSKTDAAITRMIKHLAQIPRAHPAANYIG